MNCIKAGIMFHRFCILATIATTTRNSSTIPDMYLTSIETPTSRPRPRTTSSSPKRAHSYHHKMMASVGDVSTPKPKMPSNNERHQRKRSATSVPSDQREIPCTTSHAGNPNQRRSSYASPTSPCTCTPSHAVHRLHYPQEEVTKSSYQQSIPSPAVGPHQQRRYTVSSSGRIFYYYPGPPSTPLSRRYSTCVPSQTGSHDYERGSPTESVQSSTSSHSKLKWLRNKARELFK